MHCKFFERMLKRARRTKVILHENFYHENLLDEKANYSTGML